MIFIYKKAVKSYCQKCGRPEEGIHSCHFCGNSHNICNTFTFRNPNIKHYICSNCAD